MKFVFFFVVSVCANQWERRIEPVSHRKRKPRTNCLEKKFFANVILEIREVLK